MLQFIFLWFGSTIKDRKNLILDSLFFSIFGILSIVLDWCIWQMMLHNFPFLFFWVQVTGHMIPIFAFCFNVSKMSSLLLNIPKVTWLIKLKSIINNSKSQNVKWCLLYQSTLLFNYLDDIEQWLSKKKKKILKKHITVPIKDPEKTKYPENSSSLMTHNLCNSATASTSFFHLVSITLGEGRKW